MKERTAKPLSTLSKVMMIAISVVTVLLLIVTLLDRFAGLSLIQSELVVQGTVILLVLLVAWPLIALVRKINGRNAKIIVGVLLAMLLFVASTFVMVFLSYFAQMWMPSKFSVLQTEAGEKIAILRMLDTGVYDEDYGVASEQRMLERREYILSQPDAEPVADDEMPAGAYGYVYYAYPVKFGIFYDAKAQSEGQIYQGMQSESKMLYECREDGTVRFYLENPEVGDTGEIIVN